MGTTGVSVRLDTAQYSPPRNDYNDWKIALTDASGMPMPNATLTWACAWMPVHGHGTNPKKVDNLGGGEFQLERMNFSMYGPWQVRLWVDPTGKVPLYAPQGVSGVANGSACMPTNGVSSTPTVTFDICVPRNRNAAQ